MKRVTPVLVASTLTACGLWGHDAGPCPTTVPPNGVPPSPADAAASRTTSHDMQAALRHRVEALVAPRVAARGEVGVVVGVVEPAGDAFFGFGRVSESFPGPPDAATRFEIGSVSKLFAGLLLAEMALRREVGIDDSAQSHLPSELVLPSYPERPITLLDLATHTSGLSELPWDNPAMRRERGEQVQPEETIGHPRGSTYTRERLAKALRKEKLTRAPGSAYHYSSLGIGLLGIALSQAAGVPLAQLQAERIRAPLGLEDTHYFHEVREFDQHFAQGHDAQGKAQGMRTDEEAIEACCGMRSSARDLAKFLRAQFESGPLAEAAHWTQLPQRAGGNTYLERIGFAWHLLRRPPGRMYKLGRMNGYSAYVELDRDARRAVIVLAAQQDWPVEEVALALLPRPEPEFRVQTRHLSTAALGAAQARWEDGLRLLEAAAVPRELAPGQALEVRLRFAATQAVSRNLRLFLHADGRGGRLKTDHEPTIPVSAWNPGDVLEHTIRFRVPDDYPAGELQLWPGFFDLQGRARVLVGANDGEHRVRGPTALVVHRDSP